MRKTRRRTRKNAYELRKSCGRADANPAATDAAPRAVDAVTSRPGLPAQPPIPDPDEAELRLAVTL